MDQKPHPSKKTKKTVSKAPPLREKGDLDLEVKTPFLWIMLLAAPVLLGVLLSLRAPPAQQEPAPIQEQAAAQAPVVQPQKTVPIEGRRRYSAAAEETVAPLEEPPPACDFAPWVGLPVGADMQAALRASNRPYRVLPPGSMMTMDHSPARVNFDIDERGIITRVWCG